MIELVAAVPVVFVLGILFFGDFQQYSIFCFGSYRRVTRSSVKTEGHECADCESTIEIGERRSWHKELVAFGVPILRYSDGIRRYCYDHADIRIRDGLEPVESQRKLMPAIDGAEKNSLFEDISSVVTLLPIMAVVIPAAIFLRVIRAWTAPLNSMAEQGGDR